MMKMDVMKGPSEEESVATLLEKLKAKFPKQLEEEPLMDDLLAMSGEEDMGEEEGMEEFDMEEEMPMEEGMEDEMENYEDEDAMMLEDEELDLEGLANSPDMAADDEKKKKDLARRMSVRSKLRM